MEDLTENFTNLYQPLSALVFYQSSDSCREIYAEYFDIDKQGNPINAHPLSVREAKNLSKALNVENEKNKDFLKPKNILSLNILNINPSLHGSVLWYTKSQKIELFFVDNLEIPNGFAQIPALIWLAHKNSLSVFAVLSDKRPCEKTVLYHAPFFNVYENGNVCMGTVDVNIKNSASVEEFTMAWENYFFNSYFSHLVNGHNPIKGNCVTLWKEQVNNGKPFPKSVLKKTNKILKNILP